MKTGPGPAEAGGTGHVHSTISEGVSALNLVCVEGFVQLRTHRRYDNH